MLKSKRTCVQSQSICVSISVSDVSGSVFGSGALLQGLCAAPSQGWVGSSSQVGISMFCWGGLKLSFRVVVMPSVSLLLQGRGAGGLFFFG